MLNGNRLVWNTFLGRVFRDQVLNVMRYHVYKTSQNRHLLLGDSQVKRLDFSNINILSLPGAGCHQAYAFKPPEGKYDTISLFIGGNDLYNGYVPSKKSVETVIDNICELANDFCERTERVYVFGIPPRFPLIVNSRNSRHATTTTNFFDILR